MTHSHIFLFAKEAHANVVPERGALGNRSRRHTILVHGHIKVAVGLHHTACSQDGLEIKTVIKEILEGQACSVWERDERQTVPHDTESSQPLSNSPESTSGTWSV